MNVFDLFIISLSIGFGLGISTTVLAILVFTTVQKSKRETVEKPKQTLA